MAWEGKCIDDGSGRNVYFVDNEGKVGCIRSCRSIDL